MRRRRPYNPNGKQHLAPETADGLMWFNTYKEMVRVTPADVVKATVRWHKISNNPRWDDDPSYNWATDKGKDDV